MVNHKNFCPLPWIHLSLEPSGNVYSCCNTSEFYPLANVKEESFDLILMNEKSKRMREVFSRGDMPKECELCVIAKKHGQISLQEASQVKFSNVDTNTKPEIRYLSLRLSNSCNFACDICSASLSTAWYKDAKVLNKFVPSEKVLAFGSDDKFKNFLSNIPSTLEILYFAGGEPFLSKEFYQVIEVLIEKKMTDVEIILNTNFSKYKLGKWDGLKLLSHFSKVSLDLSIDGIEKNGEYSRFGFNWMETRNLIDYTMTNYPDIKLSLFPTISIFNIFHLEEMLGYFLDNKVIRPKAVRINPLFSPAHMSVINLPKEKKIQVSRQLDMYIKYLYTDFSREEIEGLVQQLKGVINLLAEPGDPQMLTLFKDEIEKIDKLRNRNIKDSIPELSFIFDN